MKTFALLIAAVAAQEDLTCQCLADESMGLPPSTLFTDRGYPEDYGTKCFEWDLEDPSCQEGGDNYGVDWCTGQWCYVGADCATAYDTVFFADTEYAGTLKFDVKTACPATSEEGSNMLYASAAAVIAAVAASI